MSKYEIRKEEGRTYDDFIHISLQADASELDIKAILEEATAELPYGQVMIQSHPDHIEQLEGSITWDVNKSEGYVRTGNVEIGKKKCHIYTTATFPKERGIQIIFIAAYTWESKHKTKR